MPKKKNPFSYFLDSYRDEQRRKGRNLSFKVAADECGPLWKKLPDHKKKIYYDLAHSTKGSLSDDPTVQYQDPVTGELGEAWLRYSRSGEEVPYLNSIIKDPEDLKTHNFYIVHCNYFCKVDYKNYLPAELAVLEFNLQEGIKRTYHTLIDPGQAPMGYAYEVKRLSDDIHGLPTPPYDEGEKDLLAVFKALEDFMESSKGDQDKYAPLFTLESNALPAMHILNNLDPSFSEEPTFIVYPIHRFLFWAKNKSSEFCGKGTGFPVLTNAITELEKDAFRFTQGISCKFHSESVTQFMNCSLSIIQRLVYLICDHCCRHLKIKLVGGKHVHMNFRRRRKLSDDDEVKSPEDEASARKPYPGCMLDVASNYAPDEPECSGVSTYASSVADDIARLTLDEACGDDNAPKVYTLDIENLLLEDSDDEDLEGGKFQKVRGKGSRGRGSFAKSSKKSEKGGTRRS